MRGDTAEDFAVLHDRRVMDADGTPGLRGRFIAYLDRRSAVAAAEEDAPAVQALTLDEACARLKAGHPLWWECVDLCCRQGLTEREVAVRLGVSPALAHRCKAAGLGRLATWCEIDDADGPGDVALLLRRGPL